MISIRGATSRGEKLGIKLRFGEFQSEMRFTGVSVGKIAWVERYGYVTIRNVSRHPSTDLLKRV